MFLRLSAISILLVSATSYAYETAPVFAPDAICKATSAQELKLFVPRNNVARGIDKVMIEKVLPSSDRARAEKDRIWVNWWVYLDISQNYRPFESSRCLADLGSIHERGLALTFDLREAKRDAQYGCAGYDLYCRVKIEFNGAMRVALPENQLFDLSREGSKMGVPPRVYEDIAEYTELAQLSIEYNDKNHDHCAKITPPNCVPPDDGECRGCLK